MVKGVILGNPGGPDPISGKTLRGEMSLPGEEGILPVVSSLSSCWELTPAPPVSTVRISAFPRQLPELHISQFLAIQHVSPTGRIFLVVA